jgi:hypothetical protein
MATSDGSQKKTRQPGIASFFSNPKRAKVFLVDMPGGGHKKKCPVCGKLLFSQGFANHMRFHTSKGDTADATQQCFPTGRIKCGPKFKDGPIDFTKQPEQEPPQNCTTTAALATPISCAAPPHQHIVGMTCNFTLLEKIQILDHHHAVAERIKFKQ